MYEIAYLKDSTSYVQAFCPTEEEIKTAEYDSLVQEYITNLLDGSFLFLSVYEKGFITQEKETLKYNREEHCLYLYNTVGSFNGADVQKVSLTGDFKEELTAVFLKTSLLHNVITLEKLYNALKGYSRPVGSTAPTPEKIMIHGKEKITQDMYASLTTALTSVLHFYTSYEPLLQEKEVFKHLNILIAETMTNTGKYLAQFGVIVVSLDKLVSAEKPYKLLNMVIESREAFLEQVFVHELAHFLSRAVTFSMPTASVKTDMATEFNLEFKTTPLMVAYKEKIRETILAQGKSATYAEYVFLPDELFARAIQLLYSKHHKFNGISTLTVEESKKEKRTPIFPTLASDEAICLMELAKGSLEKMSMSTKF